MENEQQNKDSIEKFIDTYISEIKLVFFIIMETPIQAIIPLISSHLILI